jgi:hypothetical protein
MASDIGAGLSVRNQPPRGWKQHAFERRWAVKAPRRAVWSWLNDPSTFTRQIWPFRVEFLEGSGVDGASGFAPGVLNAHHGPLLNACGVITEIDEGADGDGRYRDLQYYYGSFVIGMRFVRPTRLQFWVEDDAEGAAVRVRIESDVARWFAPMWSLINGFFWLSFPQWMRSGARKRARTNAL